MTAEPPDDVGFRALTAKIAADRGFGCANYKDGCVRRRIAVRMRARGAVDFSAYAALLELDPSEYDLLLDALTINVTKLYRDAEVWGTLAKEVLPALWTKELPSLDIWSAGCASGEELYTLAALVHQLAERTATLDRLRRVRILGSDIDRASLEAARLGAYPTEAFAEMPVELRTRYFSATSPHLAAPELRALVAVERRDLLSESPPAGPFQLISCRNVVIYFDRPSQEPLIRRFHAALAPGGYLLLGKVETLMGASRALFEVVDHRNRIFRRVETE